MSATITLKLTPNEVRQLRSVAGNGWGDGDFKDWILAGGTQRDVKSCESALEKLDAAWRRHQLKEKARRG